MFKRLYREFFYVPKYAKMTDKVFKTRIGVSALTMLLCCALFCATTFAWFTSQQSSPVSPIVAADYSLSVAVNGQTLDANEYTCPLAAADEHKFTITATGTATTGYCKITANNQTYGMVKIAPGQEITLTIVAKEGTGIVFSACWGAYSGEGTYYGDGAVIQILDTPYQSTVPATEPVTDSEQEPTVNETTPAEPAQTENTEPSESAEPTEQSDVETVETQQTE